jgi:glutathione S-transferase
VRRTSEIPELWQTEWCPASARVRQRLTELGVAFLARAVPVAGEARAQLRAATGQTSIPVLVAAGEVIAGEEQIRAYLDRVYSEPPEAAEHRTKAEHVKHKLLEEQCRKLE